VNLGDGSYDVTVTDANGCTVVASYILTEPDAVEVTGITVDPSCNVLSGVQDGTIDITATGGTPGYTYLWDGPFGATGSTSEDLTDLGAGTYNVTITDANDCEVIASFTLSEPTEVVVSGGTVDLDCNSGSGAPTGAIDITASGGQGLVAGDYTYAWTGTGVAASDEDQTGLSAGTYTVVVTDANGCSDSAEFTLTEPTAVEVTAVTSDLTCNAANGPADGTIDVMPSGGQGLEDSDYTYNWVASAGGAGLDATSGDQTDLTAGTYSVTVTDSNGCTAEGSWTLIEPSIISILASTTDLECNDASGSPDGEIQITVSGGTGGYTYAWTGTGVNPTSEDQTGLTAGTYSLIVTDANGCTQQDEYTLTEPDAVEVSGVQGWIRQQPIRQA